MCWVALFDSRFTAVAASASAAMIQKVPVLGSLTLLYAYRHTCETVFPYIYIVSFTVTEGCLSLFFRSVFQ
jgi:hypothetical protein